MHFFAKLLELLYNCNEGGYDVNLSKMMAANHSQLQHTLNLSLINSSMNTQAAQAITMLDDMAKTQPNSEVTSAPHPMLGNNIDIKV